MTKKKTDSKPKSKPGQTASSPKPKGTTQKGPSIVKQAPSNIKQSPSKSGSSMIRKPQVVKKKATSLSPGPSKNLAMPASSSVTQQFENDSVLFFQEQRARIALRAYELYEERCRIGADVQDWLRAEREIMGKQ